jgi:predicted nucleic acid-binding protein
MRAAVLDTSVAVAWYLPEVHEAARAWQAPLLDGRLRLLVPGLH